MLLLVIEDDANLSELMREKLEKSGYSIVSAYTAHEAMTKLEENTPHIMILDYTLPDMNAQEFLDELAKKNRTIPPFIISTGQGDERLAVEMMKMGARDYIKKDHLFLDMLPVVIERVKGEIEKENRLRQIETDYRLLAENACDVIWILDLDMMCFTYMSPSVEKLRGYTPEEALGQSIADTICPESYKLLAMALPVRLESYRSGKSENNYIDEIEQPRKNGTTVWTESTSRIVQNKTTGHYELIGASRNITTRRTGEEKIAALLAEKELILKEVHHRIKNNLSTIQSMLSLQAGTLKDTNAVGALEDAQSRIQSMMILYDKLYQSTDCNTVSVGEYLPILIDDIIQHFPNASIVTVKQDIQDFTLDAKKMQSVGIIINELITNIMKYAFTNKPSGVISISMSLTDNRISLIIADDGLGIPDKSEFDESAGFGLTLVAGLARQLKGTIKFEREQGTKITLEFSK